MAFFDLQVNGYAGVDFNSDDWSIADLRQACERLKSDDVVGILATIITDDLSRMCDRLRRLVEARIQDPLIAEIISGFHIEGPFLNEAPGYIGAHPPQEARPANLEEMQRLLDAAGGLTRIVTLAPERDDRQQVTRFLADQQIVAAAGHCDPSIDQLRAAMDAGLSMFTHLGNGCPLQLHRHDNVIQRVLSCADRLWIGLIGDGVHVPFPALGNYVRCAGLDHTFIVTDAIAAAGQGPGHYRLSGKEVVVDDQLATWSSDRSHLMGSAITMPRVADNLRRALGLSTVDIERLTHLNPRQAIGIT